MTNTMNRGGGDGTPALSQRTDLPSAPSPLTSLDQFVALAKQHGSPCVAVHDAYTAPDEPVKAQPFKVGIRSADTGDCGLDRCRCSPGLWVNAFEDGKVAIAYFGQPLDHSTYEAVDASVPDNWSRGAEIDIERKHLIQFFGFLDDLGRRNQAPGA